MIVLSDSIDLLLVGITIAGICILGFSVFFNDRKNITNISLLSFAIFTSIWSTVNFLSNSVHVVDVSFWLLRIVMFLAAWHAYSFFQLAYVFPKKDILFPGWYKKALLPAVVFISGLTLTPAVFIKVTEVVDNKITKVQNGFGIAIFGLFVGLMILSGIFLFVRKMLKTKAEERLQYRYTLTGFFITFILILTFNFILPAFFDIADYTKYGALFIFPFIAFTSFSIIKYKMMNLKVISTEILVFFLSIITFFEVVFSTSLLLIIIRSAIFVLVLFFGISLIRSVFREVEQRNKIEKLAWELSNTNTKLESANEKLKELDKQKTEFVSIAAHQLRSPLTAIKGYSSMLLEGSFGKVATGKPRDAIQVIYESSNKLAHVIEDFLNVTRIELGKMHYDMTTFDLVKMAESVVNELKPNIQRKGLAINFSSDPGPLNVTGDTGKISQVLSNIIDNAVKYTKEGGLSVSVTRRQEGGKTFIRFASKDTGIGLDKETIPKLFEKFIRADGAGQINVTGTGLGLYVAKQIVEGHQGKIWAESEGKGKGSTFIVEMEETKGAYKPVSPEAQVTQKAVGDLAKAI